MARRGKAGAAIQAGKDGSGGKKPEFILARYTRLEALFEMIEFGGVPLYGTEHWDDECDKEFVRRGCEACNIEENDCGIICFAGAKRNEISKTRKEMIWPSETSAHWVTNDKPPVMDDLESCLDTRIRIEFAKDALLKFVKPKVREFRSAPAWLFNQMDYEEFQKYLKKTRQCKGAEWFFLKREAYFWEGEWRLVALNQTNIPRRVLNAGARGFIPIEKDGGVDWWKKAIWRIVFSPYSTSKGYSGKPNVDAIRFYARKAFDYYCAGKRAWSKDKKELVYGLIEEGYRSGVLDNAQVLTAAKAKKGQAKKKTKAAKPAKKAAAKKSNATKKRK